MLSVTPLASAFAAGARAADQSASRVEALFDGERDMAAIKFAIDAMAEPDAGSEKGVGDLERMKAELDRMIGGTSDSLEKLALLKRYLYEPGAWNGGRAFQYDITDPNGQDPQNRLLGDYLADRRGNCVSMPILFMILGQHIGLKMTLAEAPLHLFVKFTDDSGREWNLEATSGGGFTRDSHYRKITPMSDAAIASGLYLRGLSREETIGVMAAELVDHHLRAGRYEEAIADADIILKHAPKSAYLLVKRGSAYAGLLRRDITSKYNTASAMSAETKAYADSLYRANLADFAAAEALGWREQDGQL